MKNDILMEVFDDQRNIIALNANDKEEFLMFDRSNYSKTIDF